MFDLQPPRRSGRARAAVFLLAGALVTSVVVAKPSRKPLRAVTVQEAERFSARHEALSLRKDRRAVDAYRPDSQMLLWLTVEGKPVNVLLTGTKLRQFVRQAVASTEKVRTGTSCMFAARPDGQVLESCASINVARPTPTFSLSLIARDRKGLTYKTVLVTDSVSTAQALQVVASHGKLPSPLLDEVLKQFESGPDESADPGEQGSQDLPGSPGDIDRGMVRPPQ